MHLLALDSNGTIWRYSLVTYTKQFTDEPMLHRLNCWQPLGRETMGSKPADIGDGDLTVIQPPRDTIDVWEWVGDQLIADTCYWPNDAVFDEWGTDD